MSLLNAFRSDRTSSSSQAVVPDLVRNELEVALANVRAGFAQDVATARETFKRDLDQQIQALQASIEQLSRQIQLRDEREDERRRSDQAALKETIARVGGALDALNAHLDDVARRSADGLTDLGAGIAETMSAHKAEAIAQRTLLGGSQDELKAGLATIRDVLSVQQASLDQIAPKTCAGVAERLGDALAGLAQSDQELRERSTALLQQLSEQRARHDEVSAALNQLTRHSARIDATVTDEAAKLQEVLGMMAAIDAGARAMGEQIGSLHDQLSGQSAQMDKIAADAPRRVLETIGGSLTDLANYGQTLSQRTAAIHDQFGAQIVQMEKIAAEAPQRVLDLIGGPLTNLADYGHALNERTAELMDQLSEHRVRLDEIGADVPLKVVASVSGTLSILTERWHDVDRQIFEMRERLNELRAHLDKVTTEKLDEVRGEINGLRPEIENFNTEIQSVHGGFPRLAEQIGTRLSRLSEQMAKIADSATQTQERIGTGRSRHAKGSPRLLSSRSER